MAKKVRWIMGPLGVMMVIIFIVGYRAGAFGVPLDSLESFARDKQPIPEEWLCIEATQDDVAAFLFYPEDQSNAIYTIYVKGSGLSFGYHTRSRGFMHAIQESVCEFQYGDRNAVIFLSLNLPGVTAAEVRYADGTTETVKLDPAEPFALALPLTAEVTLLGPEGPLPNDLRVVVAI